MGSQHPRWHSDALQVPIRLPAPIVLAHPLPANAKAWNPECGQVPAFREHALRLSVTLIAATSTIATAKHLSIEFRSTARALCGQSVAGASRIIHSEIRSVSLVLRGSRLQHKGADNILLLRLRNI
jgi:hypothetical protein